MRHVNTAKTVLAAAAVLVAAALPVSASIPREWWVSHAGAQCAEKETGLPCAATPSAVFAPSREVSVTAVTHADGEQVVRIFYDLAGNRTNKVDAASRRTEFRYDALNRLVFRSAESAQSADAFSYDAAHNLLSASNAVARETFAYDAMDCVSAAATLIGGHTFGTAWTRDLGGLATNVTLTINSSLLTVNYSYDADGQLASRSGLMLTRSVSAVRTATRAGRR